MSHVQRPRFFDFKFLCEVFDMEETIPAGSHIITDLGWGKSFRGQYSIKSIAVVPQPTAEKMGIHLEFKLAPLRQSHAVNSCGALRINSRHLQLIRVCLLYKIGTQYF